MAEDKLEKAVKGILASIRRKKEEREREKDEKFPYRPVAQAYNTNWEHLYMPILRSVVNEFRQHGEEARLGYGKERIAEIQADINWAVLTITTKAGSKDIKFYAERRPARVGLDIKISAEDVGDYIIDTSPGEATQEFRDILSEVLSRYQ